MITLLTTSILALSSAFVPVPHTTTTITTTTKSFLQNQVTSIVGNHHPSDLHRLFHHHGKYNDSNDDNSKSTNAGTSERRQFLSKIVSSTATATTGIIGFNAFHPSPSLAEDVAATATTNAIEMKTFVDPKGLFAINVPKRFFAIRRTVKGDLPDEATGKGRRGSSIFTAGDMAKAEVVAVERFPTKVLLEEEGIIPSGDLSTFTGIGDPTAIANLIAIRRDRDKQAQMRTIVIPNSVSVSEDGKTLFFRLSQSIDVQKPELLMEQTGVSELVRVTSAKAMLTSNDGQMMAVFASALEQDYASADGPALEESVDSFIALDQSKK